MPAVPHLRECIEVSAMSSLAILSVLCAIAASVLAGSVAENTVAAPEPSVVFTAEVAGQTFINKVCPTRFLSSSH